MKKKCNYCNREGKMRKTYIEKLKEYFKPDIANKLKKIIRYKYKKDGTKTFTIETKKLSWENLKDIKNNNWRKL